jgi:hypothetical protein
MLPSVRTPDRLQFHNSAASIVSDSQMFLPEANVLFCNMMNGLSYEGVAGLLYRGAWSIMCE